MTPFRYRDIRENVYFRASEIPFNFEYLDYALKPFLDFICKLEGWKTKCKNLHWAAPKKNVHVYLDEFLEVISDY